jgi:hypothetical protein
MWWFGGEMIDCLNWLRCKDKDGYGKKRVGQFHKRVHRLAYEEWYGPIPKGKLVCHTCDNPACYTPEHLFLGTNQDNMEDMKQKGRQQIQDGENNHRAFLTDTQILEIRIKYASTKFKLKELAAEYECSITHISNIINNRRREII